MTEQKHKSQVDITKDLGFSRSIDGVKNFEIKSSDKTKLVFFAKEQPDYNNKFVCCVKQRVNEDGIVQGLPKHYWFNIEEWPQIKAGLDKLYSEVTKNHEARN